MAIVARFVSPKFLFRVQIISFNAEIFLKTKNKSFENSQFFFKDVNSYNLFSNGSMTKILASIDSFRQNLFEFKIIQ
jgi:hypothetical protein